ncbi:MAG: hypothetical protein CMN31_14295 [Sandaracinus sp.]|nr:hypothetical protein [Myxococcales bacterium]MBJ72485.1 hypothetical protein [Sandaracinus sp.]
MRQVQVADPDAVSARSAGRLRAPGRRETFAPMSRRPLLALFGVASAGALALTAAPEGAAQPSAMDARSTMEATAMEATAMDPTAPTSAMVAEGAPSPARSAADEARRARVYAEVGEVTITVGDIEDAIAKQSPFLRTRYRDPRRLRELADSLVRFELLARAAEERDYDENPVVVRAVKQIAVQQLIEREFDRRITRESITDEEIQAYYDAHADEFSRPEMVRASHILLASRDDAEELLNEARDADARGFRQLAREHSIDTETKLRGGDLRYFTRDGRAAGAREDDTPVDATLVEAAFGVEEVGGVAREPVRVGEHWSIVKLTGRRPAETRSLEQASEGIRLRLWREKRQNAIDTFVSELRQAHPPEMHADRMRAIRLDPAAPGERLPTGAHHGRPAAGDEGGGDESESAGDQAAED